MAPALKKYRQTLLLTEEEAANVLQIHLEEYTAMESGDASFAIDQLKALWNWLTPKWRWPVLSPATICNGSKPNSIPAPQRSVATMLLPVLMPAHLYG
jgi:hypothetical protein